MNWDAVIAIAEIVGVVAVIASLIYVAVQIRQSTDIARASIVHETSVSFSRFHELLAADSELTSIYIRGVNGEDLSEIDAHRFNVLGIANTTGPVEAMEGYDHARLFQDLAITQKYRVAWVELNPDATDMAKFIETVLINRGLPGRIFASVDEAKSWLPGEAGV